MSVEGLGKDFCGAIIPDNFFPIEKLRNYTQMGLIRDFAKGSAVIMPGEEITSMIFLVEGKIKLDIIFEDGSEKLLYYAGGNSLIGKLYPTGNNIYATAMEPTRTCWFSEKSLRTVFRTDEDMIFEIFKNYLTKVAYYARQVAEMNTYNPTIRILRLFYELCSSQGKRVGDTYEITMPLSQKSIGEITGVHHVTVSRVLASLKRENILDKKKNKIIVYNLGELKHLSEQTSYYSDPNSSSVDKLAAALDHH
uniref:Cyclic nucleotide-binding protein n=1 Tax=Desulfitobacterium hafniense (strain DSM 10664 / DCB-2) TaxID=272564 RepID=UPI000181BA68|nr:Chain A, Cyclic nucleotide-binding protein [Desulfitobacterium hafniense DCB-2]3E5U_B Chain B, Cyclic nucleotide-binding protein [Desulfitobacterium hafniense DCB-2]3E5U_C Chain C, Cyclic nucleotide-binding protein [Desulfitobacterium hafniense DCB-2]3E5U_D Chain D, Cyclic nucleotide-binding protein [Desulfitobacterium hafniense DCB-2]3E6B_A Chain A, Cyclic nucleotide-binding protein [Desulfitobacterium hafniense DCB-2]3E6B_B Chain B, Cyclic nucleotide-binding protein [Desulfitobacterium ha